MELELLHWRSAENGNAEPSDSEGSEADGSASGDKYKRRFERAHRELQLLRAQLRRQHEDDLEQLVTVKKQLEKKVGSEKIRAAAKTCSGSQALATCSSKCVSVIIVMNNVRY